VKRTVERGKTLLVDGPASVTPLSGEAEVLGAPLKIGTRMVIRDGKRVPLAVTQKAEFDLTLGDTASVEEVDGSTVPASWEKAVGEILSPAKPTTVMVMGGVDSGKTSLSTYIANKALRDKRRVALIDADLGQADVGPPSTIGVSRLTKLVRDPFDVRAEDACFVGVTSPSGAVRKVIECLVKMKKEVLKRGAVDLLIVNTDGWVEGEDAVRYKVELVDSVAPDIVVGIHQQDELTFVLAALKEKKVISVESPPSVRRRDRDQRRTLRELSCKKYLRGAKIESFPLSWTRVEGIPLGTGVPPPQRRIEEIEQKLGATVVYCEETPSMLFVVAKKSAWLDEEVVKGLEQALGKRVCAVREGDEEGLLVALLDASEHFLGIGLLHEVDYEKRVIRVYTPVRERVASVSVGAVKLDKSGREVGSGLCFRGLPVLTLVAS